MEKHRTLKVAIVGGGPGCKAIMDMMLASKLRQLHMKVLGVACTNSNAVGYRYAQEIGIYATSSYCDLYKLEGLDMIIELTGRSEVADEIARSKPDRVRLMDHVAARLFWDIFQIEEERLKEREQAEDALREATRRLEIAYDQAITYAGELNQEIAERKQIEKALQSAHDELEQRVKERTAELSRAVTLLRQKIAQLEGAEKALRESENKYRTLLENLPQRIFHKDRHSVYVSCNENYARDLNIRPEQIKGKTDYEFFPRELAEKYIGDDRRIMASGKTEEIEETYPKNGQDIWVQTVKTPVKDSRGIITGILGIFWDITHRKRAQEALRKREIELEIKTNSLEEVNAALRVLLTQRDEDTREVEEKVLSNVNQLVIPYLQKLKRSRLDAKEFSYLSIVESNLDDIVSPFAQRLSLKYAGLTPTEIRIAHLVKEGKTTKEMAELLNVATATIESHRKRIRMKLGIKNSKTNLRSHLLTVQNR